MDAHFLDAPKLARFLLFVPRESGSLSLSSSTRFFLLSDFGTVADVGVGLLDPPAWFVNDVDRGVGA